MYECNECYKPKPCLLKVKDVGDVPPTLCPFAITNEAKEAVWIKSKDDALSCPLHVLFM